MWKPEVTGSQALLRQHFSPLLPRERIYLCGRRAAEQAEGLHPALLPSRPLPVRCPRGAASSPACKRCCLLLLKITSVSVRKQISNINEHRSSRAVTLGDSSQSHHQHGESRAGCWSQMPALPAQMLYEHSDLQLPQNLPGTDLFAPVVYNPRPQQPGRAMRSLPRRGALADAPGVPAALPQLVQREAPSPSHPVLPWE